MRLNGRCHWREISFSNKNVSHGTHMWHASHRMSAEPENHQSWIRRHAVMSQESWIPRSWEWTQINPSPLTRACRILGLDIVKLKYSSKMTKMISWTQMKKALIKWPDMRLSCGHEAIERQIRNLRDLDRKNPFILMDGLDLHNC